MARANKKGRAVNGIIVVDKPTGRSSNHVLQQVKRLFNARKAGHTGNLDPLATGVLPICFGEATKVSSYLLDTDKRYQVTCRLGAVTDTGDVEGKVISQPTIPKWSKSELIDILKDHEGQQQQVPPMFSALKHKGQPLYKLARQGLEVERKARTININKISLIDYDFDEFRLDVYCSKGTYIRTLVEDISEALGTGGHVTELRRTHAAGYDLSLAHNITELERQAEPGFQQLDSLLLPIEDALPNWPRIHVTEEQKQALRHGQEIMVNTPYHCSDIRLFDSQQTFLGIGKMSSTGYIKPKRVFVETPEQ